MSRRPLAWLDSWLKQNDADLIATRRHIHAHPELSRAELQTTAYLMERLSAAGLSPKPLPGGTGLVCDVGDGGRTVALRADIDALALPDVKEVPYRSTVPGVCHACGHDAHAAILLGVALALAHAPALPGRVRCIFQPAEEVIPGGALDVIDAGGLKDVERIFALHCDPRLELGRVGLRVGPITAACDSLEVRVSGSGGHTARPHLTADLVYALGQIITQVPALLSRVADPRAAMSLVWGVVEAGAAANAIPQTGVLRGTVRMLDRSVWDEAGSLICRLINQVGTPTGVQIDVAYEQGVPAVVNDEESVGLLRDAVTEALGAAAVSDTPQSLGGEDFGWYLNQVPGALFRLGVHSGGAPMLDLHRGSFDIDERALAIGVRTMIHTTYAALLS
ncbi:MAG: amidohydrolase [Actinobacteria bacterium]|nr:amidohydrolase [Actinomycetota bacterium]MBI3687892.1 amidohydrolase [Actinomycetota bacterium]